MAAGSAYMSFQLWHDIKLVSVNSVPDADDNLIAAWTTFVPYLDDSVILHLYKYE